MSSRYPKTENNPFLQQHEDENDERLEALHGQVAGLKAITIEIGNEVRGQNQMLDGMAMDFGNFEGLLGGAMGNLRRLAETEAGRNYLFWTVLFVLFTLLVLYWFFL